MRSKAERFYRAPIVWLGAAILIAIVAACVSTIMLAQRYPDHPSSIGGDSLLHMPLSGTPTAQAFMLRRS